MVENVRELDDIIADDVERFWKAQGPDNLEDRIVAKVMRRIGMSDELIIGCFGYMPSPDDAEELVTGDHPTEQQAAE